MRNIEIVRRQERLDALFKLPRSIQNDPELQAHWAKYLCVLVFSFIEFSVATLYSEYARNKSAPYVANFVDATLEDFRNPNVEKILAVTRAFSPQWADQLSLAIEGEI